VLHNSGQLCIAASPQVRGSTLISMDCFVDLV